MLNLDANIQKIATEPNVFTSILMVIAEDSAYPKMMSAHHMLCMLCFFSLKY